MPRLDDTPLAPHAATPAELQQRVLAERRGDPFLVYRRDPGGQQLHALHPGLDRVTIGRGPSNDVALPWDTEVSRVHAELERLGGEWTLVDDGLSRNGTWVNGTRIAGRHRLRDGDVVQIGQTLLAYRIPDPEDSRPTVAAGRGSAAPTLTAAQRRVLEALCRPYKESEFASPATNQAIAEELFLSVDAVKAHLRALFAAFGIEELPQNQKRSHLAMRAMQLGLVR
ncbi:MAG TPA: FHA domain-containing protein [Solirubrobacteraceae bacterium]|nr:FHA domain-containing protein [Solirubrobacteraceae bacterium]